MQKRAFIIHGWNGYSEEGWFPWLKFVCVFSDNDLYIPFQDAEIFKEKLAAKIIIEHNKKHFSGRDGINELPSVLNAVLLMSDAIN